MHFPLDTDSYPWRSSARGMILLLPVTLNRNCEEYCYGVSPSTGNWDKYYKSRCLFRSWQRRNIPAPLYETLNSRSNCILNYGAIKDGKHIALKKRLLFYGNVEQI